MYWKIETDLQMQGQNLTFCQLSILVENVKTFPSIVPMELHVG